MSVLGCSRIGSLFKLSVVDIAVLGSSLSLRSFSRIASSLSIRDYATIGASLSVRSFARFGSYVSIQSALHIGGAEMQWKEDQATPRLETNIGGARTLTLTSTGGELHGTWFTENHVATSDRRLKKDIQPLYRAIAKSPSATAQPHSRIQAEKGASVSAQKAAVVDWVLRELRPVSFSFKQGAEAKQSRYGFIAQELERVLPDVVRRTGEGPNEQMSVVYQDFIALLTMSAQTLQERVAGQQDRIAGLEKWLQALDEKLDEWTQDQVHEDEGDTVHI